MKIKITKEQNDVDERIRPRRGNIYEVKEEKSALYNPQKNKTFLIDIKGYEVMVFANECELVDEGCLKCR